MASGLFDISGFQRVVDFDTDRKNVATGANAKSAPEKIGSIALDVIEHLQSQSFVPKSGERKLLQQFVEKIRKIDEQFAATEMGSVFSSSILALDLLQRLKFQLEPDHQAIANSPFILNLAIFLSAETITDSVFVATQLRDFQKTMLIPAFEGARSRKEVLALQAIANSCAALTERLADPKAILADQRSKIETIANLKACTTHPFYSALIDYPNAEKPDLADPNARAKIASNMSSFVAAFIRVADNPSIRSEDKIAICKALVVIRNDFKQHRAHDLIDPVLIQLHDHFGLPQGITGSFSLILRYLATAEVIQNKAEVGRNLIKFQESMLMPAVTKASSKEELLVLEPLVNQCIALTGKLNSIPEGPSLNRQTGDLRHLWNAKHLQTSTIYQKLINYEKGHLTGMGNRKKMEVKAKKIDRIVSDFLIYADHPIFSPKDQAAIFKAIVEIREEFGAHGAKGLIDPILEKLKNGWGIEEPRALPPEPKAAAVPIQPKKAPLNPGISARDAKTVQRLAKEIIDLKPTIGDAASYDFLATHGKYVNDLNTKAGSLAMLAAGLAANASGKLYTESPEAILKLGQSLLQRKSGQCDHMAAAVIAKIVAHIKNGGAWDSDVELMGNGGHAFIVVNRPSGPTNVLKSWQGAIVVDTWLGRLGVNERFKERLPSPIDGVVSGSDIPAYARFFRAKEGAVQVMRTLSAEDLKDLARSF